MSTTDNYDAAAEFYALAANRLYLEKQATIDDAKHQEIDQYIDTHAGVKQAYDTIAALYATGERGPEMVQAHLASLRKRDKDIELQAARTSRRPGMSRQEYERDLKRARQRDRYLGHHHEEDDHGPPSSTRQEDHTLYVAGPCASFYSDVNRYNHFQDNIPSHDHSSGFRPDPTSIDLGSGSSGVWRNEMNRITLPGHKPIFSAARRKLDY